MRTKEQMENFLDSINDDFICRNYSIFSIVERIEKYAGESNVNVSYAYEHERYGIKRWANLDIACANGQYTVTIEQTGGDGIYATYIK